VRIIFDRWTWQSVETNVIDHCRVVFCTNDSRYKHKYYEETETVFISITLYRMRKHESDRSL